MAMAGRPQAPSPGVAERYFTRWYRPDGEEYTIYSCIRGRLMEVNESLLNSPSLLQQKPFTDGYIAVVLPKFEESKSITRGLLTRKEYEEVLSKRFNPTS